MKIVISDIPDEGTELDLTGDLQLDEIRMLSPVKATLRIDKLGPELIARGVLSARVEIECARCLNQFPFQVSSQLNLVFRPASEISKHEQYELKSEELDTVFYTGDILETDDLLKEQLILNLPMKALCSPDCKGFCPGCGTDLNVSGCSCRTVGNDPRFEILKKLKSEKEQ
jgi:uncharacterized protein